MCHHRLLAWLPAPVSISIKIHGNCIPNRHLRYSNFCESPNFPVQKMTTLSVNNDEGAMKALSSLVERNHPRICPFRQNAATLVLHQSAQTKSMVTCILLRYTKIKTNFSLPAERSHCRGMFLVRRNLKDFKSEIILL